MRDILPSVRLGTSMGLPAALKRAMPACGANGAWAGAGTAPAPETRQHPVSMRRKQDLFFIKTGAGDSKKNTSIFLNQNVPGNHKLRQAGAELHGPKRTSYV